MPQRRSGSQSPGEHAKQQIRDLGQAVRNTARKVAQTSPNSQDGDKAISELQQRVRGCRQTQTERASCPSGQGSLRWTLHTAAHLDYLDWPLCHRNPDRWLVGRAWSFSVLVYISVLYVASASLRSDSSHSVYGIFNLVPHYYSVKRSDTAMVWYDKRRSQQRNLCSFAFTYAQIVEQTIFARINDRTTP
jgi:hypothetical protein